MNATREVVYGSLLLTFFYLLAGAIAYLTKLVLVRNLSVEEYGLFFSVLTLVLLLQAFISLGLPTGLARTIAKYRVSGDFGRIKSVILGSASIQTGVAFLVMGVLFLLSDYLALNYFNDPDARWLLIVLLLYFPLNVLRMQFKAIFNGFSKNTYLGVFDFIYNLGVLIVLIIGFYFFSGIVVPVIGYIGTFVISFLLFMVPLFKTFNIFSTKSVKFTTSNKELFIFSLPLLFTVFGSLFVSYFDTLMLTYYQTLVEVGVYNIVLPTALLLVAIGGSIGLALLPIITKLWEEGKKEMVGIAFSKIYIYILALVIPAIIILVLLSEHIIRFFFGEEYLLGTTVFMILVIGSLFNILFTIQNTALVGIGKSSSIMWVYLTGSITNIILNIILIPSYSLTGAGLATVLSFMLMFALSLYLLNKEFTVKFPIFNFFMLILFSLSIVIIVHLFWMLNFNMFLLTALGLGVGLVLYGLLVLLFRIIKIDEFCKLMGIDLKTFVSDLRNRFT